MVARGFTQHPNIDFSETFSLATRMDTVRTILVVTTQNKWNVYQMDVKSTFLNGYLNEEVYVEQPQVYEVPRQEHKVYKMKKELYGLKQAPRSWYSRIDSYLTQNGFHRSESELKLYTKVNEKGNMLIVYMYVDDLIFRGDFVIKYFRKIMESEFEMTDLGLMTFLWALKSGSLKEVNLYIS